MKKFLKTRECKKCESTGASTKHITSRVVPDYMKRRCIICGFTWREKPLDAEEKEKK